MKRDLTRRGFIAGAAVGAAALYGAGLTRADERDIRVVVWDEQQVEQKKAYENFLGNAIADFLRGRGGMAVRSVNFKDPEQGLSDDVINNCDVMVYWSHFRTNPLVKVEKAKEIVQRIRDGKMSLVTLHSAHWSMPFVEAMRWRTKEDAMASLTEQERKHAVFEYVTPKLFVVPKRTDSLTPSVKKERGADGKLHVTVTLPDCVFPAFRGDGKPSHVTVLKPDHPLAKGLPLHWDIPQTEMYDEPFHVPTPDEIVFEEKWDKGEHFRSGLVWKIGKGKVVYFRPGHETYPVYKQEYPLKVIENACRWLGGQQQVG